MLFLKILAVIGLVIAFLASVVVIMLGFPGEFLIVLVTLVYILIAGTGKVGWGALGVFALMAVGAEVVEFFAGFLGAKKLGGSTKSGLGALAGGILGAFGGTFLIPIPLVGSVAGVLLGTFIGAAVVEYLAMRKAEASIRAGAGAFFGRLAGIFAKVSVTVIMVVVLLFRLFSQAP